MERHVVQCFYGQQTKHYEIQHSTEELSEDGSKKAIIDKVSPLPDGNAKPKKALAEADAPADEEEVLLKAEVQTSTFLREGQSQNRKNHSRYNAHHAHVASDENDLLIDAINSLDLGWKADTCKYQKHHANYGSHCEQQAISLAQTGSKESDVDNEGRPFGQEKNFQQALTEA